MGYQKIQIAVVVGDRRLVFAAVLLFLKVYFQRIERVAHFLQALGRFAGAPFRPIDPLDLERSRIGEYPVQNILAFAPHRATRADLIAEAF